MQLRRRWERQFSRTQGDSRLDCCEGIRRKREAQKFETTDTQDSSKKRTKGTNSILTSLWMAAAEREGAKRREAEGGERNRTVSQNHQSGSYVIYIIELVEISSANLVVCGRGLPPVVRHRKRVYPLCSTGVRIPGPPIFFAIFSILHIDQQEVYLFALAMQHDQVEKESKMEARRELSSISAMVFTSSHVVMVS